MIGVSNSFTSTPCGIKGLDRAAVFAAEVIQISDVVIRLSDQQRHVMLSAKRTRPLISGQSPRKVVQTDQAHRHVAENDRDSLHILVSQHALVSTLIMSDGFLKAVLAVIDIADIDFQSCETPLVIETGEDFSGAF